MHDFYYYFSVVKSLHFIFIVSYFAGLFYMVRLFIYHTETQDKPEAEKKVLQKQFQIMERKLWNIITVPAAILIGLTGYTLLHIRSYLLDGNWIYIKFTGLIVLLAYHVWTWKTLRELQKNIFKYKSVQLRMLNEVATLLLFFIVFVAVLKEEFINHWYWVLVSFVLVGILIMLVVRLVNLNRKKN